MKRGGMKRGRSVHCSKLDSRSYWQSCRFTIMLCSVFYMWCILVACRSLMRIGYGVRMGPQRMTNLREDLDPVIVVQEKCKEYLSRSQPIKNLQPRSQPIKNLQPNPTGGSIDSSPLCGEKLISGSDSANISEFPHMAIIGREENNNETEIEWNCGGSLISPEYVLTAAHCFNQIIPRNDTTYWVILGQTLKPHCDVRRHSNDSDSVYRVVERINHPGYNPGNMYHNDIALLKLDRPAALSEAIRPLCLAPPPNLRYNDSQAIVTGWGQSVIGEQFSDDLRWASLNLFHDDECVRAFPNDSKSSNKGFDAKSMICAGPMRKPEGDTCEGDSGGPLQYRIVSDGCDKCYKKMFFLFGITSYGSRYCGVTFPGPGIYTKVSNFLPWIQSIVWPAHPDIRFIFLFVHEFVPVISVIRIFIAAIKTIVYLRRIFSDLLPILEIFVNY